jgi:hypothetical protein
MERLDMENSENIEPLVGTGYICKGLTKICRTRYRVDTYLAPSEDIMEKSYLLDVLKELRVKIKPIEISLDSIFGRDYTLVLEDGRKLDFFITETLTGTIIPTTGIRP